MADQPAVGAELPPDQQAIRARCIRRSGGHVHFDAGALDQPVAMRFAQQVVRHRARVAVKTGQHAWTYDELNRATNRVARAILASRGNGAEPVGLLFANGANAIIAALGTLKAGKFYVPLDPTFPDARLAAILEDAGARLLVTSAHDRSLARRLAAGKVGLLDVGTLDANVSDEDLSALASAADLACLIYTSGSTGRPKGVMHTHQSLLHWIMVHTNDLGIAPEDRLSLLHSWSVGSGLFHLWASLLNGAAVLPFDVRAGGGDRLARWLHQERVTVYHSVPAVFRQMAAALTDRERFPELRAIILSGAPMSAEELELYQRHFASDSILLHMMGASEVGWIRRYFIDQTTKVSGRAVPVGYAITDNDVMLLDESAVEVDRADVVGARIGEIAVKSRYLALGYWRQPELTATKFASAPEGRGLRIYRTGDLGRMEPDGCLFHLGRKDFQVKVRAHRVETGEVERALLEHPDVKDVAAIGRPAADGDTQLVAYFVSAAGQAPTITELRRYLKDRLPDYMVPATFVRLAAIPFTPNGKLDYAALPAPDALRPELDAPYVAPGTEIERAIALAWQDVLGLGKVGMHDNFFDLGGNSLLLGQLHDRLQAELRKEFPFVEMFQHPTVDALVRYLFPSTGARAAIAFDSGRVASLRAGRTRLAQLADHRQGAREAE
jgi:amino acid adenylation domain-containing protein